MISIYSNHSHHRNYISGSMLQERNKGHNQMLADPHILAKNIL